MGNCCPSGTDQSIVSVERSETMKLRIEMKKFELDEDQVDVHSSESDSDLIIALSSPNSNQQGNHI